MNFYSWSPSTERDSMCPICNDRVGTLDYDGELICENCIKNKINEYYSKDGFLELINNNHINCDKLICKYILLLDNYEELESDILTEEFKDTLFENSELDFHDILNDYINDCIEQEELLSILTVLENVHYSCM